MRAQIFEIITVINFFLLSFGYIILCTKILSSQTETLKIFRHSLKVIFKKFEDMS